MTIFQRISVVVALGIGVQTSVSEEAHGKSAEAAMLSVASGTATGPKEPGRSLEVRLMGTWVLAKAERPGKPSGIGIRQKKFSPGRWEIIQRDPKSGEIVFHHGGTYRLDSDLLEQKVEFATEKTRNYIGQVRRFRIRVEGDVHIQIGVGNPFNEVWVRPDGA
jgi:hypothetical protein